MALNGLLCADVPFRIYTLSLTGSTIIVLYHRNTFVRQTRISHVLKISYLSEHNEESHTIRTTCSQWKHAMCESL